MPGGALENPWHSTNKGLVNNAAAQAQAAAAAQQQQIQDAINQITGTFPGAGGPGTNVYGNVPNPTGGIGAIGNDIEDAWYPGSVEAGQIYGQGMPPLDPNNYLDTTMQNLMGMQNPQQNPYLLSMLNTGQESIANQVMSSLGRSGRGPGSINPVTGQASDSAIGLIDNLGNYTNQFLGSQYQQDMNRAMQATLGGGDFMSGTLQMQQNQPWKNLQNYAGVVGNLTGSSPQQPNDPKTSGWDQLLGLGSTALGIAALI